MIASPNPAAPHHLPAFVTAPGETDVLMVVMAVFLVAAILATGLLFLRLHSLPERLAHKGHKLQFEIVAVLGLLALFTHVHLFWVIGLLLALIDIPDFGWPLRRMAGALEKIAGMAPGEGANDGPDAGAANTITPPEAAASQEALHKETRLTPVREMALAADPSAIPTIKSSNTGS